MVDWLWRKGVMIYCIHSHCIDGGSGGGRAAKRQCGVVAVTSMSLGGWVNGLFPISIDYP